MEATDFFIMVVLVTASGALAPGILFYGTLLYGLKHGARAGFMTSVGHTLVELPLALLIALGLITIAHIPLAKRVVGFVGGITLLSFGLLQLLQTLRSGGGGLSISLPRSPLLLGILFSALNPFFIVWWLTAGAKLVLEALAYASLLGVLLMYTYHVWMDYAWLTFVAYAAGRGRKLIESKAYRIVLSAFSIALVYYGARFLLSALT